MESRWIPRLKVVASRVELPPSFADPTSLHQFLQILVQPTAKVQREMWHISHSINFRFLIHGLQQHLRHQLQPQTSNIPFRSSNFFLKLPVPLINIFSANIPDIR
uniref:Uncharacterized protein n=1 Tax=Lygus hesperus TaxID=30085 RepID=A0A0K8TCF8_LYGHE